MAFTVTARHSAANAGTSTPNLATNSTTPTANALFFVCIGAQMDAFGTENLPDFTTVPPTGGSLTYSIVTDGTTEARHGDVTPGFLWGTTNGFWVGGAIFSAPIGASPSAFTVTGDGTGSADNAFHSIVCFDLTGHAASGTIVQVARNGARINPESSTASGTVTFANAPASGNLIAVAFMCGVDAAGAVASPTAGVGKTFNTVTALSTAFCTTGVFTRVADGTESLTITSSDLGQTVGNYVAIAFEIALASAGPTPTDNLGLTDSIVIDHIKGVGADSLGLTDTVAFTISNRIDDALDLTDFGVSQFFEMEIGDAFDLTDSITTSGSGGFSETPTDNLGLTDSIVITLSNVVSDNLGLTDAILIERSVVQTDALDLTDVASVTQDKGVTDQVDLTDTASTLVTRGVNTTDTLDLTDTVDASEGKGVSDNLGLTDVATSLVTRQVNSTDDLGLTDSVRFDLVKGITDSLDLTDTVTTQLSGAGSVSLIDTLGMTDALVLDYGEGVSDDLGLTDVVSFSVGEAISVTDNLGLTDSIAIVLTRDLGDTLSLTDIVSLSGSFARVMQDQIGLSDTVLVQLNPTIEAFRADIGEVDIFSRNTGGPAVAMVMTGASVRLVVDGPGIAPNVEGVGV